MEFSSSNPTVWIAELESLITEYFAKPENFSNHLKGMSVMCDAVPIAGELSSTGGEMKCCDVPNFIYSLIRVWPDLAMKERHYKKPPRNKNFSLPRPPWNNFINDWEQATRSDTVHNIEKIFTVLRGAIILNNVQWRNIDFPSIPLDWKDESYGNSGVWVQARELFEAGGDSGQWKEVMQTILQSLPRGQI